MRLTCARPPARPGHDSGVVWCCVVSVSRVRWEGGGVAVFTPDGVFTVTLHTHTCSARPCEQGLTAN